ncbi:MAG: NAD-dependent epimerase/dehydratase family protein [Chloroflexota bacterium]
MSRQKRILVTGGAGFIGTNLIPLLLQRGYHVTVLDNLSTGSSKNLRDTTVDFVEGDILDVDLVNRVVAGHDGVVHLAAQTGVPASLLNPKRDCEVNVLGTLNVLEACRLAMLEQEAIDSAAKYNQSKREPLRMVFASSNAPLGRQAPPANEDKAALPISPYGASKLAGEGYCLAYHGSWGVRTIALRFGNVYGPFSGHKGSVVAKFFTDISTKGKITIDGDGQQSRDFIYVGDLCRAIVLALESKVSGEIFQISAGVETTILELASLVQKTVQSTVTLEHGASRQGDIQKNYSTITKARQVLKWEPVVKLEDGLRHTWEWFSQEFPKS